MLPHFLRDIYFDQGILGQIPRHTVSKSLSTIVIGPSLHLAAPVKYPPSLRLFLKHALIFAPVMTIITLFYQDSTLWQDLLLPSTRLWIISSSKRQSCLPPFPLFSSNLATQPNYMLLSLHSWHISHALFAQSVPVCAISPCARPIILIKINRTSSPTDDTADTSIEVRTLSLCKDTMWGLSTLILHSFVHSWIP